MKIKNVFFINCVIIMSSMLCHANLHALQKLIVARRGAQKATTRLQLNIHMRNNLQSRRTFYCDTGEESVAGGVAGGAIGTLLAGAVGGCVGYAFGLPLGVENQFGLGAGATSAVVGGLTAAHGVGGPPGVVAWGFLATAYGGALIKKYHDRNKKHTSTSSIAPLPAAQAKSQKPTRVYVEPPEDEWH